MLRSILLAATALFTLAACATAETDTAGAAPPADRDCFNVANVSGFSSIDDNHVRLSVGANRAYALTTSPRIIEARYFEHLGIRSTTNWICTGNGLGVDLIVPNGIPENYRVTEIVRLPDDAPATTEPAAPQGS
ncbi:MAG: DUF6491 family protein [Hyphomonadaceae bacterium]|nr:DUF6491 family protein [Hyphomonadaceae bacterium]